MLYVIGNSNGHVKIGITDSHVERRLSAIQNGNPIKVSVLKTWKLPTKEDDRKAEKQLHRQLSRYRKSGEWFLLSPWGMHWLLNRDIHDFDRGEGDYDPGVMHFKDTPLYEDVAPPSRPTMDMFMARLSDKERVEWNASEQKEETAYWCQLTMDTAYDLVMSYANQSEQDE